MFENYVESLRAFNINAYSNLMYQIQTNIWILLLIVASAGTTFLGLKDRVERTVKEEQNVL